MTAAYAAVLAFGVGLTGLVVSHWLGHAGAPRRTRRYWLCAAVVYGYVAMVLVAAIIATGVYIGCLLAGAAGMAMLSLAALYSVARPPTDEEAAANYLDDQSRCGRCDYSLTGGQGHRCPECGCLLPAHGPPNATHTCRRHCTGSCIAVSLLLISAGVYALRTFEHVHWLGWMLIAPGLILLLYVP